MVAQEESNQKMATTATTNNIDINTNKENKRIDENKQKSNNAVTPTPNKKEEPKRKAEKEFELEDLLYCIPNKITFDPTKSSPFVHLGVFLGILTFMFLLSYNLSDVGTMDPTNPKKKARRSIHSISSSLESFVKRSQSQDVHYNNARKGQECDLYFAASSIPGRKMGVFAGKAFEKDDVVLPEGISVIVQSINANESWEVQLPHLLLNSHPNITNLLPTTRSKCHETPFKYCDMSSLQASRSIAPGDELMLGYNENDKGQTERLEQMNKKYNLLDDIIKDIMVSNRPRRAGNKRGDNFGLNDSILRTIKNVIRKFNPEISNLLPNESSKLREYVSSGSAYQTLQNRTLPFLLRNGVCMMQPAVQTPPQTDDTRSLASFSASKEIRANDNITRIPLFPMHVSNDETNKSFVQHWNCFLCAAERHSYVCPTLPTKFRYYDNTSNDNKEVNAKYEWLITSRKEALLSSFITRADGKVLEGLQLNIIAIRDISIGEEVVIGYDPPKEKQCTASTKEEGTQCVDVDLNVWNMILPDL